MPGGGPSIHRPDRRSHPHDAFGPSGRAWRPDGRSPSRVQAPLGARWRRRAIVLGVAIGLGASFVLGGGLDRFRGGSGPLVEAGVGTVVHLVDGDTLDVEIDGHAERVRLLGVDTPESVARDRPNECYGAEASARLAELVPVGTAVHLERDRVARDRYGRLLAYVWRVDDGVLVNLALVEGGFADAVTFGDNEALYPMLAAAESVARAEGRGLWGACGSADVPLAPAPR